MGISTKRVQSKKQIYVFVLVSEKGLEIISNIWMKG